MMRLTFAFLMLLLTSNASAQTMTQKMNDFYTDLYTLTFEEKLEKIDKAIKKKPNEPWYYWMKADVYGMMDNDEKTIENYHKSIEIDSNFSAGHASLARHLYTGENKRLDEALVHINKAIELEADGYHYYIDRGNIYLLSKQYDMAIAEANRVIAFEDNNFKMEAIQLIVESLYAQNKKQELKNYLQKNDLSQFGCMDTDYCLLLGDLYLEFGNKEKACRCYHSAEEPYLMMEEKLPEDLAAKLKQCD